MLARAEGWIVIGLALVIAPALMLAVSRTRRWAWVPAACYGSCAGAVLAATLALPPSGMAHMLAQAMAFIVGGLVALSSALLALAAGVGARYSGTSAAALRYCFKRAVALPILLVAASILAHHGVGLWVRVFQPTLIDDLAHGDLDAYGRP